MRNTTGMRHGWKARPLPHALETYFTLPRTFALEQHIAPVSD
jgi:hypothetical protein